MCEIESWIYLNTQHGFQNQSPRGGAELCSSLNFPSVKDCRHSCWRPCSNRQTSIQTTEVKVAVKLNESLVWYSTKRYPTKQCAALTVAESQAQK